MLDKCSEVKVVSDLALEMRKSIYELAGTRGWQENRKSWLAKVARKVGITPRQARSLFYMEGGLKAAIVDRVREAKKQELIAETRDAYAELNARIGRLEALLRISDQDFHGPEIDALREIAGRKNSTVD
jgi:AraC-like DNA-binding protein